jgi:hypothetical protein
MSTQAIHDDLEATLSDGALTYSIVTKYICKAQSNTIKIHSNSDVNSYHFTSPHLGDSTRLSWQPLKKKRFHQCPSLGKPLISKALLFPADLSIHFGLCYIILAGYRIELSSSLLWTLEVQERRAWHDITAFDKSWFYDSTDYESIWLRPGEKVPER